MTLVWVPLWPLTSVEIPSFKEQVEIKDILKIARESFTRKFLHYFATLLCRQQHCKIWLVYTWKMWALDISCWPSDFTPLEGEGGRLNFICQISPYTVTAYARGGFLVASQPSNIYSQSFYPKWVGLSCSFIGKRCYSESALAPGRGSKCLWNMT